MKLFRWIKALFTRHKYEADPIPDPAPKPPKPVPVPDGSFPRWEIRSFEGFTDFDEKVMTEAVSGLNQIAAHPRFKEEVFKRFYYEDDGGGGALLWSRLCSGEQLTPEDKPGVLDLKVVMYADRWSKVVGYTYLEDITVWINRKFYSTPQFVASNIAHESTHQLGYTHEYSFEGTVPYQMNEIVEMLWDELGI